MISVRSGSGRATWNPKAQRIALADVTAVGARPAVAQDSPWITLSDGRGLSVPPGDVVVVQCRDATQVLPVDDAAVCAEVIRTRAGVAALPTEVATDRPRTTHVPEILPAPEPTGPPAHPVTGPAAPPRRVAGAALRAPGR